MEIEGGDLFEEGAGRMFAGRRGEEAKCSSGGRGEGEIPTKH